uniref:Uncharacterized protein n=1 Tax=Picornavirales sp. TaxID=1955153 RepID=A0A6M3YTV2_9VIRU|nr:MAG: hypothetical protein 3 [Picornavirales sp.]
MPPWSSKMITSSSFVPPSHRLTALYRQLDSTPMHLRQQTSAAILKLLSGLLTRGDLKKYVLFLTEQYDPTQESSITTRAMRFLEAYLRVLCHCYELHLKTSLITVLSSSLTEVIRLAFGNHIHPSHLKLLLDRFIDLVQEEFKDPLNFTNQQDPVHIINRLPITNLQVNLILKSKLIVTNVPLNLKITLDLKEPTMKFPNLEIPAPLHRIPTSGPPKTSTHLTTPHTTDHQLGTSTSSHYTRTCLCCDLSLCKKNFKNKSKKSKTWRRRFLLPLRQTKVD